MKGEINWADYKEYASRQISSNVEKLGRHLNELLGVDYSEELYSCIFFMPVSQIVFLEYLRKKHGYRRRLKKCSLTSISEKVATYLRGYKVLKIDAKTFPVSDIVSMRFWYRHSDFAENCINGRSVSELEYKSGITLARRKRRSDALAREIAVGHDSFELSASIKTFITNHKSFANLDYPRLLLCSAHGLYNGELSRIYVAFAKAAGTKVVCLQPGFIHGVMKYFDQVEYELQISDVYLSWGENLYSPNALIVGCPYSHRASSRDSGKLPGELIILPQVPRRTIPAPISFYWGQTYDDFLENEKALIRRLKVIQEVCKKATFRCKDCDFEYYSGLLKSHFENPTIDTGDINSEEHFRAHEKVFITYFSTALPESLYKNMHVVPVIPREDYALMEPAMSEFDAINEINDIQAVSSSLNQRRVNEYLAKYAHPTNPGKFKRDLSQILKCLEK